MENGGDAYAPIRSSSPSCSLRLPSLNTGHVSKPGSGLLFALIVALTVFLPLAYWLFHGASPSAAAFVVEARRAFSHHEDEEGVAFLAAAMTAEPANAEALDLYCVRVDARYRAALDVKDWAAAEVQIAAYDSAVRAGLKGVRAVEDVRALLARQKRVQDWEDELASSRDNHAKAVAQRVIDKLAAADLPLVLVFDAELKELAMASLGDKAKTLVANAATRLEARRPGLERTALEAELDSVRGDAAQAGIKPSKLRELSICCQQLRARLGEARYAVNLAPLQADCEAVISEIDQRLQVLSIRQMQQIADVDAKRAIEKATAKLDEIAADQQIYQYRYYQWRGEKLAEAEVALSAVDRLCSEEMQRESRRYLEGIRRDAVTYRIGQQREYNLWAIRVLEAASSEFDAARGIIWSDKEALKRIISDRLGEIDAQHLHPVTHALFTEMYQKILAQLSNDLKVEVTRHVELKTKKPIADF